MALAKVLQPVAMSLFVCLRRIPARQFPCALGNVVFAGIMRRPGQMKILRKEKPDVIAVHFGNELPTILMIIAISLHMVAVKRVSWVWHQRQQISDPKGITRYLSKIRLASLFFDHIVVSYKGALRSMQLRRINEKNVSVIYNSLRESESARLPYVRESLEISETAVVIANVGWLVPRKRTHLSIKAFAAVCISADMLLHLLLVGDGPQESSLRDLVKELDIEKNVHFLGMREDVREILDESDILIHTSQAETCTNVVQEAMAASCPVVMMDAGAAREQVADGVTGFIVGVDDSVMLEKRLAEVVMNAEKRKEMGAAAKQHWYDCFRLSVSVEKHCNLYRSIASGTTLRQFPDAGEEGI